MQPVGDLVLTCSTFRMLVLIELKTMLEKEKMLAISIFSFSNNFFKRLPFHGR